MATWAHIWAAIRRDYAANAPTLGHVAIWGAAALAGVALAVAVNFRDRKPERMVAPPAIAANEARPGAQPQPRSPWAPEYDNERQWLVDSVRLLIHDRYRLAARIDELERNLDELTGSIKRPPIGHSETNVADSEQPSGAITGPPDSVVTEPVPQAAANANGRGSANAKIGADIGGAESIEGLRALWDTAKEISPAQFGNLHPLIAVREDNHTKAAQLRLVVGPIENAEAALRLCAALTAAQRPCRLAVFEGQRLVPVETIPGR